MASVANHIRTTLTAQTIFGQGTFFARLCEGLFDTNRLDQARSQSQFLTLPFRF
jgi:hypothetical protein